MANNKPQQLTNRGIANAALLVMLLFVLSRVTGLAREVVIGAQFGTSADLDAYLAAFRVPDILFQLVAGGALGSAFIPTFSAYLSQKGTEAAWLLFSRVLNLITLLLVLLAAAAALGAPFLVESIIAPGFSIEQQTLTTSLMRWMLLSTVLFGGSGLIMGALNANQHFLYPAAAPIFYNVAIGRSAHGATGARTLLCTDALSGEYDSCQQPGNGEPQRAQLCLASDVTAPGGLCSGCSNGCLSNLCQSGGRKRDRRHAPHL